MFCKKTRKKLDYYREQSAATKEHYFDLLLIIRSLLLRYDDDGNAIATLTDIKELCEEAIGWVPTLDIYEMSKAELFFEVRRSRTLYNLEEWAPLPGYTKKRIKKEKE